MKKSVKVGFKRRMCFTTAMAGLALLVLTVSLPASARAAGDSDGNAKLQAMRSDVEACMQPGDAGKKAREAFAKKYNVSLSKVNEKTANRPPAGNGTWDHGTATAVCSLEWVTLIGAAVWERRSIYDKFKKGPPHSYCVEYSMNCDHYSWRAGCLKQRWPDCCD